MNLLSRHPTFKDLHLRDKPPETFSLENQWGSHPEPHKAGMPWKQLLKGSRRLSHPRVQGRNPGSGAPGHVRVLELRPDGQASCLTHMWGPSGMLSWVGAWQAPSFALLSGISERVGGGGSSAIFFVLRVCF